MTGFRIEPTRLDAESIKALSTLDPKISNWPVVYTLDSTGEIYVGESINGSGRLHQHLDNPTKNHLTNVRIIIGETFNKSVCLDLESYLIRLFAGDGKYEVLNRNDGIADADYYGRQHYQNSFEEIFEQLRKLGMFTRSVRAIENTDLFKLSPFKALTPDQAIAVEDILSGLFDDLEHKTSSRIIVNGDPGTGKTVVAIYLMKLLADIKHLRNFETNDGDSILSEFFTEGYPELLKNFRIGLVVPQQSLRRSIQSVFRKTPGLDPDSVLTPFQVGLGTTPFDLLIVDETHRLTQRANQTSADLNTKYRVINEKLFGADDPKYTQIDWINHSSTHQIYLLDADQSVRPMDVSAETLESLWSTVDPTSRIYPLTSQMRVKAGQNYVQYIKDVLSQRQDKPVRFEGYDLRFFDHFPAMLNEIRAREDDTGLSRMLAGYAWEWRSSKDSGVYDITIDGVQLRWNKVIVDWVNSPSSVNEVGSIHTIQGYDLNYAGVIIGPDLRLDPRTGSLAFDRSNYFDRKGKQKNSDGRPVTDDELLEFVKNIYAVLLTRGMRGTYIYACDPPLREYLRGFFHNYSG
ncbi:MULTISPECIES: DUF2075 domain-containing protein [Dietzia]|uniref:DUF2075 domain-containing protein n=1 Tax=Dietzia TaxID=37914 RepID=UPI000D08A590|nr:MULTISPECIES: DUF2075 domain-containing protein [Dietzia]AVM63141.1 AAA family ATPase [Dietzia sp. oral taxon 368]MCT1712141.1 DUF2075 domain-containing protein [Dietzia cinnamea]MCT2273518.1 DUF2075 domain-containing protein [Dietzia cinnamea]